jgi:hypothetical protein
VTLTETVFHAYLVEAETKSHAVQIAKTRHIDGDEVSTESQYGDAHAEEVD